MEKETWKDIPGYEGVYQASSLGRIKSLDREQADKFGKVYKYKSKLLKHGTNKNDGRQYVVLSKEGKTRSFNVHSLVESAIVTGKQIGRAHV